MAKGFLGKGLLAIAAGSFLVLSAGMARAQVTITAGNNPQPNEENVLLGTGQVGNQVLGVLNQSRFGVIFTSSQQITDPPNGQARIEATGGLLKDVTIQLQSGTFEDIIFNTSINAGDPIAPPGTFTVTAFWTNPAVGNSFQTFSLTNGSNFTTSIVSNTGTRITSVNISSPGGFSDLRQVRISGATGGTVVPVPEPGVVAFAAVNGIGLLGLMVRARRRKLVA